MGFHFIQSCLARDGLHFIQSCLARDGLHFMKYPLARDASHAYVAFQQSMAFGLGKPIHFSLFLGRFYLL